MQTIIIDSDTQCAKSPTGIHEPDIDSVHIEYDGDGVYVDVNCKHCGRSGCVASLDMTGQKIDW